MYRMKYMNPHHPCEPLVDQPHGYMRGVSSVDQAREALRDLRLLVGVRVVEEEGEKEGV